MTQPKINPVYLYSLAASVLAALIGLGAIQLTDVQSDLILQVIGAVILVIWGVSVPTAGAVNAQRDAAYIEGLMTPVPEDV